MGANSKIEWTDHTFNPWQGCSKVSAGCKNCYAEGWADRFGVDVWGVNKPRRVSSEGTWAKPKKWDREALDTFGRPARVFCASLADVFEDHPDVITARERLFDLIEETPNLIWQLLTKRPENINDMIPEKWEKEGWPRNVWMGTSVENQEMADERIPELLKTDAHLHFLSCEPLLGHVSLNVKIPGMTRDHSASWLEYGCTESRIDWVIVGGESGSNARPMRVMWARSLKLQCQSAGVPFFFKQWGKWLPANQPVIINNGHFKDVYDLPENMETIEIDGFDYYDLGKHKSGALLYGEEYMELPEIQEKV